MAQELQSVIDAVHALPLSDKLELLQALSEDLNRIHALEAGSTAFWSPKTIEELSAMQSAPVITDVRTLATGFWPEDESAEDINRFLAEQRRSDRMRDA
jgi:hypothetical protein